MILTRALLTTTAYFVLTLLAVASGQQEDLTAIKLEGQLSDSILEYVVNRADARAGGLDTLTMIYTVPQESWVAIGFSNDGLMVGSEAVVGLPDSGEVLKYSLSSYAQPGVVPMSEVQQTLIEPSIVQEGGNTILQFTKLLNEVGEVPIAIGANTFIGAYGFNNNFSYHQARESFALDLVAGEVAVIETRNRALWKAHGLCATLAWAIFSPLAIGVAILRKWFPDGLWLKIHQYLNLTVVALTIAAFSLAVAAIESETPDGADPMHFDSNPFPHRLVGLVLVLFVLFQAVGGQCRPHNPEKGEEKTCNRRSWEILHRVLGLSLLATAWYQILSGIEIYQNLFSDSASTNLSSIFWGIIGTITGLIAVGFIVTKVTDKDEEENSGDDANGDENAVEKIDSEDPDQPVPQ